MKEIICVICPEGCHINLEEGDQGAGGGVDPSRIKGFRCKRGKAYAINEFTAPVRMLTTTVRVEGGEMTMAPVRSEKPVPKGMLKELMEVINGFTAIAPVRIGDVLIEDILGTGVNIIASGNVFGGKSQ